jgi:ATP-binding cassette subfamily F protein 3
MLLQPFNVLVMDEPTNHLDIPSKKVLKEALRHFEGTLILVSHDRDFLQGLTNMVYEFRDQKIKPYLGDINFYLEQRQAADFREVERGSPGEEGGRPPKTSGRESGGPEDYKAKKKQKALKNRLNSIESQIHSLEQLLADIDHQLLMDYDQTISEPGFFDRYQDKKKELEQLMGQWETVSSELEALG